MRMSHASPHSRGVEHSPIGKETMRIPMKPVASVLAVAALGAGVAPTALAADAPAAPAAASETSTMTDALKDLTVTVDGVKLDGFAWDKGIDLTALLTTKRAEATYTVARGAKVEVSGIPAALKDAVTTTADEGGVTVTASKDGYVIVYRFAYAASTLDGLTAVVDGAPLSGFTPSVHDYYDIAADATVRLDSIPSDWKAEPLNMADGVGFTLTGPDGASVEYRFHHTSKPATGGDASKDDTGKDDGTTDQTVQQSVRIDLNAAKRGTGVVALNDGDEPPTPVEAAVKGDPQTSDDVFAAVAPGRYRLTFERSDDEGAPLGMNGTWHEASETDAAGVFGAPDGSRSTSFMVGMKDNGRDMPESVEFDMKAGAWLDLPAAKGVLVLTRIGDVAAAPSAEAPAASGADKTAALPQTGADAAAGVSAVLTALLAGLGLAFARRRA